MILIVIVMCFLAPVGELAGQRLLRAHEEAKEVHKLMLSAEKEYQDEMYDTWLLFGLPVPNTNSYKLAKGLVCKTYPSERWPLIWSSQRVPKSDEPVTCSMQSLQ